MIENEETVYVLRRYHGIITSEQSTALDIALKLNNQKECFHCSATGRISYTDMICGACDGRGTVDA